MNVYFKKNRCKNTYFMRFLQENHGVLSIFIYNICVLIKKEIPLHRFFEHYVNRILV